MTTATTTTKTTTKPNSRTGTRRSAIIAGMLAAPLMAAGLLLGTAAIAEAQPATDAQCTSMTMPSGQSAASPNSLTRAGQIGAATGAGGAQSMPVDCTPASHG